MTEKISDQEIITRLQEVESSLWGTLLEKQTLNPQDLSELVQDPQYRAAYQRVTNRDRFDPEQSWEDEQITLLYHRINQMADAIPDIQHMQYLDDLEISKLYFDDNLSPEIQESVAYVLEQAKSKLDDVRREYATFGEISGEILTEEQRESNRTLGLQLRELLTLLPATSTGAKGSPIQIVRPISGDSRATKPEEASRQSDGVLDGMRRIAEQAAGAFGGAFQNLINHFMGGGRDHTQ